MYTIQEISKKTGLSPHTLRYYEKEGLLGRVERGPSGFRRYSDADLDVLGGILCLKNTGMSLQEIARFLELSREGDRTLGERVALLEAHRNKVLARIQELQTHLEKVTRKLEDYSGRLRSYESVERQKTERPGAQPVGRKILVLGSSGSGKSTLARKLHARTGYPLYHLDLIWWKADETHISREEFDRRLGVILQGEQWILDGDYSRTYETRIRACDTAIFLDYDPETCIDGLRQRVGRKRPDIPWVEQRLEPELVSLARCYPQDCRPRLLALLERCPEKQILIFRTRAETEAWLEAAFGGEDGNEAL